MKLSREEVLHIARLARLGLTGEDITMFTDQLSNILENFEVLKQVDTEGVPPTAQPTALDNITREDNISPSLGQAEVLGNAPEREGDFFRVRPVLE